MPEPAKAQEKVWGIVDRFAMCRLRGHHWKLRRRKGWLVVENGNLVWEYDCEDCETEKKQLISYRNGTIRPARYSHVEGYLLELGADKVRPTRAALRLECVHLVTSGQVMPEAVTTKTEAKRGPGRPRNKVAA